MKKNQQGFTVLELIIATVIFSVIMLLSSGAMIKLSQQFQKGFTQSQTQETARNMGEAIARNIQYSSMPPRQLWPKPANPDALEQVWCIADKRYIFIRGKQLGPDPKTQTPSVAVRLNEGCGGIIGSPAGYKPKAGDEELAGQDMRLADFRIEQGFNDRIWSVRLRLVKGDDDLVCSPGTPGDCGASASTGAPAKPDLLCDAVKGSPYCGTSDYSMIVVRRL